MAIPSFQEFTLPALRLASDGSGHTTSDAEDELADSLGIPEADREVRVPSGTQTRLKNRVAWAISYLVKAGLLSRPKEEHSK